MTINATYSGLHECDLSDCERHYCARHRLLWRDCDTARRGVDDYYLDGRAHYVYELDGCPNCILGGN